jgi:hypothetical protein
MKRNILVAAILVLSAGNTNAIVFRTSASTDAHLSCLPNGGQQTSAHAGFSILVEDPEPEWFSALIVYRFVANSQCDFTGVNVTDQVTSAPVTQNGNVILHNYYDVSPSCPFGLRAQTSATIVNGPQPLSRSSISNCSQPCFDCTSFPYEE